jgi:hypothetical protein
MLEWLRDIAARLRFRRRPWEAITVGSDYELRVPQGSSHAFTEEDQTLCVTLPTDPPTDVLVARWAFRDDAPADRAAAIRLLMDAFVTGPVARVTGQEITAFQSWDRSDDGRIILHGMVPIELDKPRRRDTRWWLVQFEVAADGGHYYFMHWNGPYRYVAWPVTAMFVRFRPIA